MNLKVFTILLGVLFSSSVLAAPAKKTKKNILTRQSLSTHIHVAMQKLTLKVVGKKMRRKLRTDLLVFCNKKAKHPKPLFDIQGIIPLKRRESRIVQIRLKKNLLQAYRKRLKKAELQREKDRKMMESGYAFSKGFRSVALFAVNKLLGESSWVGALLPASVNATSKSLQINENRLPKPSKIRLKPIQAMDRVLRIVQRGQNPSIYKGVVCYLTSRTLGRGKKVCSPDHPFVLNEYKYFLQSWKENRKQLKKATFSKWSAPFVEFLTQHEGVIVRQEQSFLRGLYELMGQQSGFLTEVEKALLNDYKAWGCQQLRGHR